MVLVTKRICIVVSCVSGCCDSRHEARIDPASPTVGFEATTGPAPNGLSKPLRGLISPRAIEILRLTAHGYRFHVHGVWTRCKVGRMRYALHNKQEASELRFRTIKALWAHVRRPLLGRDRRPRPGPRASPAELKIRDPRHRHRRGRPG